MEKFKVTWQVEDGFVAGSRPQYFTIDVDELEDNMVESDLRRFFWKEVHNDMEEKCYPVSKDEDEFVEWALGQIAKMKEEEEE